MIKGIVENLARIDRRIIYLFLFVFISVPLILRLKPPFEANVEVRKAYEYIENLKEGSVIMISIDYDGASMPELQPLLEAMLTHIFMKNHKVIMLGHWPLGLPLGQIALEKIAKKFNKKYGEDYVFLGYRPGIAAVILNMGKDIRLVFHSDYQGIPLDDLPMMKTIKNYKDIDLIIGYEAGAVGDIWVQFAQARYGAKIMLCATAVVWPDLYPYYQAKQIVGLIGGLRGAADYELLVEQAGQASVGMASQTVVHILILAFITLGNLGFYYIRRTRRK